MRLRSVSLLAATALLAGLAATAAGAAPAAAPGSNGVASSPDRTVAAQPGTASTSRLPDLAKIDPVRYSLKDAVVEHVQVPSRNLVDQIWVDIIRPRTKPGVKVPTIMDASPYFNTLGRGWQGDCKTPTTGGVVVTEPGAPLVGGCTKASAFPEHYDDYYVPRGYAVALMDVRGTRNSSGCQVYGDRDEVFDAVDVVDFIADQSWSNGKVGLTGGSYDGTIAIGAAVEQPLSGRHKDAVAAVIPIRAIDRWYDYHFLNGVPSMSHVATPALFTAALAGLDNSNAGTEDVLLGAHLAQRKACIGTLGAATDAGYAPTYQDATSPFWAERDFEKDAKTTKAAFFLIHGLFDFNVKTNNVGQMWSALPAKAPKKMWLLNGDHVDPDSPTTDIAEEGGHVLPFSFQKAYRDGTHRWWAQHLKGLNAGALQTPAVEVQGGDGRWSGSRSWPVASTDQVLQLGSDGRAVAAGKAGTLTWADGASAAPESAVVVGDPVRRATRLSGQVSFDLAYTLTGPDTTLTVRIDDLPPGVPADAPVSDRVHDRDVDGALTVGYGFARAFYRDTIKARGTSTPTGGAPVVPGQLTRTAFGSLPLDHVLRPGHRLRFTFSPAEGATVAAGTGGTVALVTGKGGSTVRLPVAR